MNEYAQGRLYLCTINSMFAYSSKLFEIGIVSCDYGFEIIISFLLVFLANVIDQH